MRDQVSVRVDIPLTVAGAIQSEADTGTGTGRKAGTDRLKL